MTAPKPHHYTLMPGDDTEAGAKPVPHSDASEWQALLDKLKATRPPPPHGAMLGAIYVVLFLFGVVSSFVGFVTMLTIVIMNADHDPRADQGTLWLFRVSLKVLTVCAGTLTVTPIGRYAVHQTLISCRHRIVWKVLGSAVAVVACAGLLVYVIMQAEPYA